MLGDRMMADPTERAIVAKLVGGNRDRAAQRIFELFLETTLPDETADPQSKRARTRALMLLNAIDWHAVADAVVEDLLSRP
ncbi:hypothetical protein [Elioraea sp.]|uniref:hypothetical protein n=1 Tax=Elioraea sp. TaxID=2185103 RepID=UPI003F6E7B85